MPDTHVENRRETTSQQNNLMQLAEHGQSCWLDDLSRRIIRDGELAELVDNGVRGVTANPATFAKAIIGGREYDADIANAAASGLDAAAIYERLATADVRDACDILRPVYDAKQGRDGYPGIHGPAGLFGGRNADPLQKHA